MAMALKRTQIVYPINEKKYTGRKKNLIMRKEPKNTIILGSVKFCIVQTRLIQTCLAHLALITSYLCGKK